MLQSAEVERRLLLVDDEDNIVRALVRLLRREGYEIFTANSGKEGLEILKTQAIGVIISDQRMPEMNGVEFLSKVKDLYPDIIRIVLSGYTDLKSVTEAINEGAIYKFLTKPWEDDLIKKNIEEAFTRYELVFENEYLSKQLKHANEELIIANKALEKHVERKSRYAEMNMVSLQVSQDILENLPMGVVGIGDDGIVALANLKAHEFMRPDSGSLIGMPCELVFPEKLNSIYQEMHSKVEVKVANFELRKNSNYDLTFSRIGGNSQAKGVLLMIVPVERLNVGG